MNGRVDLATRLYSARRRRDTVFAGLLDGFGEPGWDMLLTLYITTYGGQTVARERLLDLAAGNRLVARRQLGWFENQGLVLVDAGDDAAVRLSAAGQGLMDAYLDREAEAHTATVAGE